MPRKGVKSTGVLSTTKGRAATRALASFANRTRTVASHRATPASLTSRRPEVKALDNPPITTPITTTGTFILLNDVPNGSQYFQRVGTKVTMRNLHLTGFITNTATSAAADWVRIMVVYDRQTNGALPASADLISSIASSGTTSSMGLDFLNLNNRDRFTVLRNKKYVLPTVTNTAGVLTNVGVIDGAYPTVHFDEFITMKEMVAQFKASAGSVADIASGSLLLYVQSQGTASWSFTWSSRLRYDDM